VEANQWEALAEDAAEADDKLDADAAQAGLTALSRRLIECCHSVAKDLDLIQAPRREGPSSVPKPLDLTIHLAVVEGPSLVVP
jgi:hypothetical protein